MKQHRRPGQNDTPESPAAIAQIARPKEPSGTRPYSIFRPERIPGQRASHPDPDRQKRAQQAVLIIVEIEDVLPVDQQRRIEQGRHHPEVETCPRWRGKRPVAAISFRLAAERRDEIDRDFLARARRRNPRDQITQESSHYGESDQNDPRLPDLAIAQAAPTPHPPAPRRQ